MNARLRIFDTDLNLIGEIDDYENLYFTRDWYSSGGEFSISMNLNKLYATDLQKGRVIMVGDNLDSIGIITAISYSVGAGGKGSETVTATGFELKHILSWRIIEPMTAQARYTEKDAAETVMKNLIKTQAGSSAAVARRVPNLTIATDQGRGEDYLVSARYSNLAAELTDCSLATNVSPRITLDLTNKDFIFETYVGTDRTAGQTINGRAIFSASYDTVSGLKYSNSDIKYSNHMTVGGQGVGTLRTIVPVYSGAEPTGFNRRERFVDARDLASSPDLTTRGNQKLVEFGNSIYLDAQGLTFSSLKYRTNYDLGDLVTISGFGISSDARISSVRESWAYNSYEIDLVFGWPYPTVTGKISTSQIETAATFNANEV